MSGSLLLVLLVAIPLVAALAAVASATRRPDTALRVAALGAGATLASAAGAVALLASGARPDAPGGALVLDGAGLTLVLVASTVTLVVARYATTNLADDPRRGRFGAGAAGLLLATVIVATAAGPVLLAAGWVGATAATLALCAHRGDAAARSCARRAASVLVPGDVAVVVGLGLVALHAGGAGWGEVDAALAGATALGLPMATVVALLLVVGALARAGQVPFGPWMVGTVEVPTPVSALLHAGSVNAGGFVLIRTSDVLWGAPAVALVLALAAGTTCVLASSAARARADVKGRLATSTAAQMGVMLLAVAVGAPGAALTHLAGHSLYKSSRFLGAGGAVGAEVARRQAGAVAPAVAPAAHLGLAALVGLGAAALWVTAAAGLDVGAAEVAVTGALLATLVAVAAWTAIGARGPRRFAAMGVGLAGALALGAAAGASHAALDLPHPSTGLLGAALAAAAVLGLAAVATAPPAALAPAASWWARPPLMPVRPRTRLVPASLHAPAPSPLGASS